MSDGWNKSEMSPSWKPEKAGDEIMGILTDKQEQVGPNNSMYYTVEKKDNHEVVGIWGSTALDTKMKKVHVGQEIRIVYKGKLKSTKRAGATYKDFDVFFRNAKADDYDFDIADQAEEIFNN